MVTNLIFPKLARAVADGNDNEAKKLTVSSMRAIVLVIAPLMAGFIVLSKPIASVIYGYGKMGAEDVEAISTLLKFYSVGMLGLGLNEILSKAFFSLQDSRTPMRNSVISMVINILLAYVLYNVMATNGLALAAAGGSIVNAVLNWFCMHRKYPDMIKGRDILNMIKAVIRFDGVVGNILTCGICGVTGVIIYGIMIFVTGEDDIKSIIKKKG